MYTCNVPVIIVRLKYSFNFLNRFSKNTQISNLIKIRPVGDEVFHANGRTDIQTDMTKVTVAFRNFAIATSKDIGGFYLALGRCVKKIVLLRMAQAEPEHCSVE